MCESGWQPRCNGLPVDLSDSYGRVIPPDVLARHDWVETRQAAAVMKASTPQEFALMGILAASAVDETRDNDAEPERCGRSTRRDHAGREAPIGLSDVKMQLKK